MRFIAEVYEIVDENGTVHCEEAEVIDTEYDHVVCTCDDAMED